MIRKSLYWSGLLILLVVFLSAEVRNADKPERGEWDFELTKEWEIENAGSEVFGKPYRLLASDEGYLYVYDEANRTNYIFDQEGTFIKAYGEKGQGPGEVRMQSASFLVDDKLVVADAARIHYFELDGTYIRSEINSVYRRRPVVFLNEHEFVAVPLGIFEASDGRAQITRINLESGQETVIADFTIFMGGIGRAGRMVGSIIVPGLTPLMVVGHGNNRLYYGMSDSYKIHVTDLNGKLLDTFMLGRKKKKVPDQVKRKYFERYRDMNRQALTKIIETTPNEATFFSRIEIHNGLVYVFVADVSRLNHQQIDIFSAGGKYLYRAVLSIEDSLIMMEPQLFNPLIKDNFLYIAVMDDKDKVKIIKYKISLPCL